MRPGGFWDEASPPDGGNAVSHRATNWAIQQRGLRPATKLVLFYLCDRHNPDYGCFPSQLQLAEDAEMGPSALNEHLKMLESVGLIHRLRRVDPRTKRQLSTRYILAFEADFPQKPSPESGDGNPTNPSPDAPTPCPKSGDGNAEKPTPDFAQNDPDPTPDLTDCRLRNPESNLVREPVTTTTRFALNESEIEAFCFEACGTGICVESRDALVATPQVLALWIGEGFDLERDILPTIRARTRKERSRPIRTWDYFTDAIREANGKRTTAIATAGDAPGIKQPPVAPSVDQIAVFHADWVNSNRYVPSNAISNTLRDAMLACGLVTPARLRERGIR